MAVQVRDPFLAVNIDCTGATHYKVSYETSSGSTDNLLLKTYTRLPDPELNGTYLVRCDLPNNPGTYFVDCIVKNTLDESDVVQSQVILLDNIDSGVSTLRNKLRIAQVFGPNADRDTYADEIKCFYGWMSIYNNSDTAINLNTVSVWTRFQNSASTLISGNTYATTPDVPATKTVWAKTPLSGTVAPGGYFLIRGPRVPENQIVSGTSAVEIIQFTTGVEDTSTGGTGNFKVDLDLSLSPTFYLSSKMCEVFLADSTLNTIASGASIYNSGALCAGFIDLYGASNDLVGGDGYLAPECISNYYFSNSKQQVKTIVNPAIEAYDNLLDYTATSIKSATNVPGTKFVRTNPLTRPRNSNFTGVFE